MRLKFVCLTLTCILIYFSALATSVPVAPITKPAYGDTSFAVVSNTGAVLVQDKKIGFFNKLKSRVVSFWVKRESRKVSKLDAKSIWGFTALGLLIGGIGVIALGAGGVGVFMILASFIASIVALAKKRDKGQMSGDESKKRRKVNWGLIAAIITGAGIVALIIALSSWKFH